MADLSLAEELGNAIDAAEAGGTDAATTTTADTATADTTTTAATTDDKATQAATTQADTGTTRARDDQGRFVKGGQQAKPDAATATTATATADATQQAATQAATTQAATTQQQTTSADAPPTTWTAAAKAEYAALSPILKAEIKKREADYQKGIETYKQAALTGNDLMRAIGNDAQMLATQYGSVGRGVRELLNLSAFASRDPGGFIQWFAQQRGINLGQQQAATAGADGQLTPQQLAPLVQQLVQPYMQQMSVFQNQFVSAQQRAEQQQEQETYGQIEAFRNATDDKGNPTHIYFDNVRGTMSALIGNGNAKTLDEAYEMACRAHPEVWASISAQQRKDEEAKRLEAARKAAEDAKRANAANVSGQGAVGMADTSKLSLRDELSSRMDGRI